MKVLMLLAILGYAAANSSEGPATLADCLAEPAAMKAKMEQMKTCAQACFKAAGIAPHPKGQSSSPVGQCFATAKADGKAFFESHKTDAENAMASWKTCLSAAGKCTGPDPEQASHQQSSGPHTYDDSNPRDRHACAMAQIIEAAKAKGGQTSHPHSSAPANPTLHTCLEACHPQHPSAQSSAQTSGKEHHHHRRHHHGLRCLHKFCTKDEVKSCAPAQSSANMAAAKSFFESEFQKTCSCLGGSSCAVNAAVCGPLFTQMEAKHAAWKAAHSSSSA